MTRLYLVSVISDWVVPKNLNPVDWLSWLPTLVNNGLPPPQSHFSGSSCEFHSHMAVLVSPSFLAVFVSYIFIWQLLWVVLFWQFLWVSFSYGSSCESHLYMAVLVSYIFIRQFSWVTLFWKFLWVAVISLSFLELLKKNNDIIRLPSTPSHVLSPFSHDPSAFSHLPRSLRNLQFFAENIFL